MSEIETIENINETKSLFLKKTSKINVSAYEYAV